MVPVQGSGAVTAARLANAARQGAVTRALLADGPLARTATADGFDQIKTGAGRALRDPARQGPARPCATRPCATLRDKDCHRCHAGPSINPSRGPTLADVFVGPAGRLACHDRPAALADSGIDRTRAALRASMADNTGFMPGMKMPAVGISDPTVQDFIRARAGDLRAE